MKKTSDNIDHRIQLKDNEIIRYRRSILHYSDEKLERFGYPYLEKLDAEMSELIA